MCVFFSITMRIEQDTSLWCNWKFRLMRICARSGPNNRCHFHMMYPQISTLQAACGWFTDRFRCAVTKVSFFCPDFLSYPILGDLSAGESRFSEKRCWRSRLTWFPLCPALLSLVPCCLTRRTAPAQRSTLWRPPCCPCLQHFTG